MTNCDYIIKGDYIVTMTEAGVLEDAAIAVSGDCIVDMGTAEEIGSNYSADRTIGGKGRAVMPGLVNTHTHSPMVLMRGLADDMPLKQWLEQHIWPAENKWLSEDFVRDAARLACLEMIRSGTTAFCDMYFFEGVVAEVASEMGLRSVLTAGVIDFPTHTTTGPDDCLKKARANIDRFSGNDLVKAGIGLHSPYTCSPETIGKAIALAKEHDVLLSIHLAETQWEVDEILKLHKTTPAMHLDGLGFFDDTRTLSSHCVWLTPDEIALMADKGSSVSHCAESNLKLASGIAPVPEMLSAGLNVSIGTDGAASNNDLDMMGEMSTVAKLHKATSGDPTALDAPTALRMATTDGARAIGLAGVGVLKKGMKADIAVIDMLKPHLSPVYNVLSHIVYAAKSSDMESLMVNGRLLLDEGRIDCADEADIINRASEWGRKIKKDLLNK